MIVSAEEATSVITPPLLDHNNNVIEKTPTNKNKKIGYLDGVRGLACLIVVFDHWISMGFPQSPSGQKYPHYLYSELWKPWLYHSPLRIFVAGEFAVALFFVLSGYVLLIKIYKSASIDREQTVKYIKIGVIGRWPRLWLPTSFTALIYYSWLHFGPFKGELSCHAPGDVDQYSFYNATYYSGSDMIVNAFIGSWFWEPAIYTIQWTLQIEFLYAITIYITAYFITSSWVSSQRKYVDRIRYGSYLFIILILPICSLIFWGNFVPNEAAYIVPFAIGGLLCMIDYLPTQEMNSKHQINSITRVNDLLCDEPSAFSNLLADPLIPTQNNTQVASLKETSNTNISNNSLMMMNNKKEDKKTIHILNKLRYLSKSNPNQALIIQSIILCLGVYTGSYPVFVKLGYHHNTNVPKGQIWLPLTPIYGWWWISFGAGCIMISALTCSQFQFILSSKLIQFLGKNSFGIYLTHYMVLIIIDVLVMPSLLKSMSRDLAVFLTLFILILPITFILANIFTIYIDSAGIEFSKFICKITILHNDKTLNQEDHEMKSRKKVCFEYILSKKVACWFVLYAIFMGIAFIPSPHGEETCSTLY